LYASPTDTAGQKKVVEHAQQVQFQVAFLGEQNAELMKIQVEPKG
jgi:hypothetical protein